MELVSIIDISKRKEDKSYKDINKYIALKKSVKKYGQLRPIIVDKNLSVIKGNNLLSILLELKIDKVFIIKIDNDDRDDIYYTLSLNNQDVKAVSFYKSLSNIDLKNNTLPFSIQELESFSSLLNYDINNIKDEKIELF